MLRRLRFAGVDLLRTPPSVCVGGGMASGRRLKPVAHERGRLAAADHAHRERVFRPERRGWRWPVERDRFSPAFGQQHRGEADSQVVFATDMELREIDAVHVSSGGLVNDPNTHFGRTLSLHPKQAVLMPVTMWGGWLANESAGIGTSAPPPEGINDSVDVADRNIAHAAPRVLDQRPPKAPAPTRANPSSTVQGSSHARGSLRLCGYACPSGASSAGRPARSDQKPPSGLKPLRSSGAATTATGAGRSPTTTISPSAVAATFPTGAGKSAQTAALVVVLPSFFKGTVLTCSAVPAS